MYLTKRQQEIYQFLKSHINGKGYAPSIVEIGQRFHLRSPATVHKHLTALENKGYLKRGFNQSRALDIAPKYYRELRDHKKKVQEFGIGRSV